VAVLKAEGLTLEDGQRAMARLLARQRNIDGVICVNDLLAIGAMQLLRSRNRDVPARCR